jgi:hypothetical protein
LKEIFDHINLGKLEEAIMTTLISLITKIETSAGFTNFILFLKETKQRDIISPTLFTIFMIPLLWILYNSNMSYQIVDVIISALAVANDIALISNSLLRIKLLYHWILSYATFTDIKIKPSKSATVYRSNIAFILN